MDADGIGIAEMSRLCGLSTDTLRWYEKEGLVPAVPRGADGRRRYDARQREVVLLLTRLRATGMPTQDMKQFVELLAQGAASHGRRVALLQATRQRLAQRREQIDACDRALDAKIRHYQELIVQGRDCSGGPVPHHPSDTQASAS